MFDKKKFAKTENVAASNLIESDAARPIQPVGAQPIAVEKKTASNLSFITVMTILALAFLAVFGAALSKMNKLEEQIKQLQSNNSYRVRQSSLYSQYETSRLRDRLLHQEALIRMKDESIRELQEKIDRDTPTKGSNRGAKTPNTSSSESVAPDTVKLSITSPINEEDEVRFTPLLNNIQRNIYGRWSNHEDVSHQQIAVRFNILPNGLVSNPILVSRGGVSAVDQAALESVRSAMYTRLPYDLRRDDLQLEAVFGRHDPTQIERSKSELFASPEAIFSTPPDGRTFRRF